MIYSRFSGRRIELNEVLQSLQKYLIIPRLEPRFRVLFFEQFGQVLVFFYSHL